MAMHLAQGRIQEFIEKLKEMGETLAMVLSGRPFVGMKSFIGGFKGI